ncbi:hypothetical protein RFM99_25675 [Mesorhizobium sp. VK4C]|uniref:hypothetical protein n=1 Tax=Mesorhizobium captivum TaxID=3072319 RepID=UPI002A2485C6|nr:hypothetical protein [Mesorhizobium sp. VK4C]MDX8501791.1 hypothetical protein [Mesorhizobium sp. VK4C]
MDTNEMQAIAGTLMRLVTPDMTPKQLAKAVKKQHPDASKKDIARAALYSLISHAGEDQARPRTFRLSLLPNALPKTRSEIWRAKWIIQASANGRH